MSVDTLLNWADIGTKARTSERLSSLLRQMPLRLGEGQKKALACLTSLTTSTVQGHGGVEKVAMVSPGQGDRDG